jgi:hypothetical protein
MELGVFPPKKNPAIYGGAKSGGESLTGLSVNS